MRTGRRWRLASTWKSGICSVMPACTCSGGRAQTQRLVLQGVLRFGYMESTGGDGRAQRSANRSADEPRCDPEPPAALVQRPTQSTMCEGSLGRSIKVSALRVAKQTQLRSRRAYTWLVLAATCSHRRQLMVPPRARGDSEPPGSMVLRWWQNTIRGCGWGSRAGSGAEYDSSGIP